MSRRIWTIDKCKVFATKCKTRTEMLKRFPRAYDAAVTYKWLNSIFAKHPNRGFERGKKVSGYWTAQRLAVAASRCKTRKEFLELNQSAFGIACKKGLIDEIFSKHPNQGFATDRVRGGYWQIKANCEYAAKQCSTRTEFRKRYSAAYKAAIHYGWLEELCSHMEMQGNRMRRFVYELVDMKANEVYVGLTHNMKQRLANHRSKGRLEVRNMLDRGCEIRVSTQLFQAKTAQIEEARLINKWKSEGLIVWNQVRAGALGAGSRYWTFERCQTIADKCKDREEMRRKFNGAAQSAVNRGWIDKIFKNHPNRGLRQKPAGYWTLERIKKLAKSYQSRGAFQKAERSAYGIAHEKGWLEKIFEKHPNRGLVSVGKDYWTLEACKQAAKKAKTRGIFYRDYPGAVNQAIDNDWMEVLFKDYPNKGYHATPRNYWTYEKLSEEVKLYKSRSEFKRCNRPAFERAQRQGFLNNLFADHLNKGYTKTTTGYWSIQRSKAEAKKYGSKMELKRSAWGAYNCLRRNGLLEYFYPKRVSSGKN